ncbi:hypothetical protein HPC62_07330 [Thermoleptolyngbya sichuanensis A183]|uniref:Uncharacterized protein n=1 Tax=Thermoleptolyngbya sichuanensis A183 TaxID=2737172 RepID=A0A6M8BB32_9CYAN|nr:MULTISPECIES: hypothetical protein [Thermoleptolyngbya]QKD82037.1 hypothetical protein HPC62_07330 [Thermoleptolyngbya sichuanensis A183]
MILSLFGLRLVGDRPERNRPEKKGRSHLQEEPETLLANTTIGLIRALYQAWLKDPDLTPEGEQLLPQEWEQKIEVLKLKLGRLHQKLMSSGPDCLTHLWKPLISRRGRWPKSSSDQALRLQLRSYGPDCLTQVVERVETSSTEGKGELT